MEGQRGQPTGLGPHETPLPLIGPVITSRFYVQFLETMANLVGNGLPLLRALELSRDATQNISLRAALNHVIDQVGDGRSFSKALIRNGSFPALLIDMIAVGEQTGKIDQSLRRAAERYDKELDKDLQRIMALIMPSVLIIMASSSAPWPTLMITAIFQTIWKHWNGSPIKANPKPTPNIFCRGRDKKCLPDVRDQPSHFAIRTHDHILMQSTAYKCFTDKILRSLICFRKAKNHTTQTFLACKSSLPPTLFVAAATKNVCPIPLTHCSHHGLGKADCLFQGSTLARLAFF
jgi:hypothetical protein